MPDVENQALLLALAQHKEKAGDDAGAIRCLEEALWFGSAPVIEEQLRTLYSRRLSNEAAEGLSLRYYFSV